MTTLMCCTDKRRLLPVAISWLLLTACWLAISLNLARAANLPPGFSETVIPGPINGGWGESVGMTFESNGRIYAWERSGRVWVQDPGDAVFSLLIDISEEVGAWVDHGLLGFALDPNFRQTGYIYLLYAVDRHHLMKF